MKLPVNFEQFKTDPVKAVTFCLLFVVFGLYIRAENQSKQINADCQRRLDQCERELRKMSKSLKTQDSICSALITEIKIYKALGKI